jgi:hypothetical protein
MRDILHRTANALHGGPLPDGLWSWHDLPELAAKPRAAVLRKVYAADDGTFQVLLDGKVVFRHPNPGMAENAMATLQWHLDEIEKARKGGL